MLKRPVYKKNVEFVNSEVENNEKIESNEKVENNNENLFKYMEILMKQNEKLMGKIENLENKIEELENKQINEIKLEHLINKLVSSKIKEEANLLRPLSPRPQTPKTEINNLERLYETINDYFGDFEEFKLIVSKILNIKNKKEEHINKIFYEIEKLSGGNYATVKLINLKNIIDKDNFEFRIPPQIYKYIKLCKSIEDFIHVEPVGLMGKNYDVYFYH
jgi:hypothetical protein